jgi:ATP adenylyltransferase
MLSKLASLPNYNLVLNKFPIIPDHFILATKSFKEQTGLLEEEDLGAAYACLRAYKDNGKDLYGFFNSGEFSGASQAHRHIQFLPVESMRIGMKEGDKWDVLVDTMTSEPGMFKFDLSYPRDIQVQLLSHSKL